MTKGRRRPGRPDREELAERLRENLRRRKAQLRARGGRPSDAPAGEHASDAETGTDTPDDGDGRE